MSLSDYYTKTITVYEEVNSGTHIMPVITWNNTSTFLGYWETSDGRSAVTDTDTEIRADVNLLCAIPNVMGYNARILLDDAEIYSITFIDSDPANRGDHAEILLKRMPKNTKSEMGL